MTDYLDIGPTPSAEPCQQLGSRDYDPEIARLEYRDVGPFSSRQNAIDDAADCGVYPQSAE